MKAFVTLGKRKTVVYIWIINCFYTLGAKQITNPSNNSTSVKGNGAVVNWLVYSELKGIQTDISDLINLSKTSVYNFGLLI